MTRCGPTIVHDAVWRHRVEVAVSPPRAELYFHDERWIDPINTQIRFEAAVFNSQRGATWSVLSPSGGPGAGTIDETGLYRAPDMGGLHSGDTDIVVATSREDPLRKAYAWVTLVGEGPLVAPPPTLEIWPRSVTLYHWSGVDNPYMAQANKMRMFRAFPRNAASPSVTWVSSAGQIEVQSDTSFCAYLAPDTGWDPDSNQATIVTVTASLASKPSVTADAKVFLVNYDWPKFW